MSASRTRSLGASNRVCTKTRNSPKRTSIWGTIGPRQPKGLMPDSLYSFIVSWDIRARSPLYRSWTSLTLGCMAVMPRICRSCLRVRGSVASRTITVKTTMAMPMFLKKMTYNTSKVLSIGLMITSVQRVNKISKEYYSLAEEHSVIDNIFFSSVSKHQRRFSLWPLVTLRRYTMPSWVPINTESLWSTWEKS